MSDRKRVRRVKSLEPRAVSRIASSAGGPCADSAAGVHPAVPGALRYAEEVAQRAARGVLDGSRAYRVRRRARDRTRISRGASGAAAGNDRDLGHRGVALCGATPFRGFALVAPARLALRPSGAARVVLSPATENSAMVHGQY